MAEYIENPLSGKLRGVTYEDGKIIDVHIRDTDDVVKVFVPMASEKEARGMMDVREKQSSEKRLIDANAMRADWLENGENEYVYDTNAVLDNIDSQPTIDAVPVIRCKDCKYCDISLVLPTGREMYTCMEGSHDHQMLLNPTDYCSYGERRDSND